MKNTNLPVLIATVVVVVVGVAVSVLFLGGAERTAHPDSGPHVHDGSHSHDNEGEATDTVVIKGFAYEPVDVKIKVGDTITWTNEDDVRHTVTSQDSAPAAIDSGLFGKGQSFSYTFKEAGQYDYYCEPHPYMKGSIVVTE